MPSIRDIVAALAGREEVEAALILGRDGLVIDSSASEHDPDAMAAMIPLVLASAEDFGASLQSGPLNTAILEFSERVAIIQTLTDDTALLVLARRSAHLGTLLFDLRRNREHIASLV